MKENRYCYSCGSVVKVTERIYAYDEFTGKPLKIEVVKCPERRWWQYESHPATSEESYCLQG